MVGDESLEISERRCVLVSIVLACESDHRFCLSSISCDFRTRTCTHLVSYITG